MDFDSSSKFIASLAKFLQSLCNGYVDFDKGVEVIGHIYINVDSDTGKKVDYVLNEKVCKNDNSITFISNSFHAQPAEKPKPAPKKAAEPEKQDEDTVVMEDSGPVIPNSTNYGTVGALRNSRGGNLDPPFTTGSKRPRTPPLRRNFGKGGSPAAKQGMSPSTRFQDSGGPIAKMGRTDIPPSPSNSNALGSSEDYENPNVFQSGGEEDDSQNFSSNFLDDQNSSEVDQKPVIDPDISIVKEEYLSNQQSSCSYAGNSQTSGPGRGKSQQSPAYPVMIHPNPSNYSGSTAASSHQADTYSSSLLESAGDPSNLQLFNVSDVDPSSLSDLANDRGQKVNFFRLNRRVEVDKDGVQWYSCTLCLRSYKRSSHLNRHIYQCTQTRSFACSYCSYVCYRKDVLKKHIESVHNRCHTAF